MSAGELWDAHAAWWKATFTDGADPEYAGEIVPLVTAELGSCERILDVGCGEGQIARALLRSGGVGTVVGIDPSWAQLCNGADAGGGVTYLQGEGERLPFPDDTFDGVVCCLAIEHASDGTALLGEVARVLAPDGRFLLLINHPMYQGPESGFVDDQILGERYWRVGPYLSEGVTVEEVDPGIVIPFHHRPLSSYLNTLAGHDVVLTQMFEPPPLPAFLAESIDPVLEGSIPRLLAMRFSYRPPVAGRGSVA
jgi:SAM-dependent methyltransferase